MPSYPFFQIDSFTSRPLHGNACAVLLDTEDLDDERMLALAREMNLSETAFVRRSQIADFAARYFTPAEEIPLAGHPTIATVMALILSGRLKLENEHTTIQLELRDGPIPVEIFSTQGQVERIVMTQRKPLFLRTYRSEDVMPAFGLSPEDALASVPIQTVSTGTPQLMIPVRDHAALRRARLDMAAYERLRASGDFFSPHLFCLGGVTPEGATFARHFGVPPDTIEDPATGSATGGMAAYLWHYRLIKQSNFVAEQGHWLQRPSQLYVELVGAPDAIEAVKVGGTAALSIRGEVVLN
ncbi:trans-2,3-dihydro-3-hydroxyanthranilate isomerase [Thermosporothrix hazakensis]|jgi:trans-2,3-dihydro-3-hydroxyanthranilate isomerase|uniref:Trans-2,3-dihydro-3-hydroxyanthranilate isomerase n=1 Tax=Thermosporothrix hazakensis TaxID=644383 RepID=A0A326UI73_THEHA|nr:PhzF family phenazine biosynthesis protein [Thermosporothrix hazakensis]PZW27969.1 trans-2,3-dihydro-3-hydroxyanthranilate isomerase [Thermosporothrix hazakensis]GCE51192.1 diaminopimelate epimerase [Thermosporothrix hazakensis]